MRSPKTLLIHTIDHYRPVWTKIAGGKTPDNHALINTDVPANVQESPSEVTESYQRNETVKTVCFVMDKTIFDSMSVSDRITFNSKNYKIAGKQDLCNRGRVFRIDLVEEGA